MEFDECDMIGSYNFAGAAVVTAISLGVSTITDQDTFDRPEILFWIVSILNEDECFAADFMKM